MRPSTVMVIAALFLLIGAAPAQAQYGGTGWYAYECPQRDGETNPRWVQRCDELFSPKAKADPREAELRQAEYQQMKARLMAQAALPAARNGLIGKWSPAPRAPRTPQGTDVATQMLRQALDGCALLFGEGATVEFRADRYLVTDSYGTDDLGAVAYREGRDSTVFVLPKVGVELMAMSLETPDRFRVINSPTPCVMIRTGANATPGTRTTPAAASRVPATPEAAPPVADGPVLTFNDNGVGYQCPDGRMPIVVSCEDASARLPALCSVVHAEKPLPRGGFQMPDTEPRSATLTRLTGCKTQKVSADAQGNLQFVK